MIPRNIQPAGQYDFFKKRTDEVAHKSHPLGQRRNLLRWAEVVLKTKQSAGSIF